MEIRDILIFEDFKTASSKWKSTGVDNNVVDLTIQQYRQLLPRLSGNEKNIDWWANNRTFTEFYTFVREMSAIPSGKQMKKAKTGDSHTLYENNEWLIVIPLDKDASCFHGRGTDWCTTKPFQSYYESYFYSREVILIYCLHKNTGDKWAIAAHKKIDHAEYFDRNDRPLSEDGFRSQTGLNPDDLITLAFGDDVSTKVSKSRANYSSAIERLDELLKIKEPYPIGERSLEVEKLLLYTKSEMHITRYFNSVGVGKSVSRIVGMTQIRHLEQNYPMPLQTVAVNLNANHIRYFKNTNEAIQMAAVKNLLYTYEQIYGPIAESVTDYFKSKILKIIKDERGIQYDSDSDEVIIDYFRDAAAIGRQFNLENLINYGDGDFSDDMVDYDSGYSIKDDIDWWWVDALREYLYKDDLDNGVIDQDEYDEKTIDDILDDDDEIRDILNMADSAGISSGTQNSIDNAIDSWIDPPFYKITERSSYQYMIKYNLSEITEIITDKMDSDDLEPDDNGEYGVDLKDTVHEKIAEDIGDLSVPYDGFKDFDESAAKDAFYSEMPDSVRKIAKRLKPGAFKNNESIERIKKLAGI